MAKLKPSEVRAIFHRVPERTNFTGLRVRVLGQLSMPQHAALTLMYVCGATVSDFTFDVGIGSPREIGRLQSEAQRSSTPIAVLTEEEAIRLATLPCPDDAQPSARRILELLGR